MDISPFIRDIPDFPKPGIIFKDITPLLANADAYPRLIEFLATRYADRGLDSIVGIESRGFIFGGALAARLGLGFVPVRKPGKLPADTLREEYALEYGTDALEIHKDAFSGGKRALIVDDVLATGGTLAATANLVRKAGGQVVEACILIELGFLMGREKLGGLELFSLMKID